MSETVLTEREAGIARVTLNRPAVLNAMNGELCAALVRAFMAIEGDPGIRVVVLRGAGGHFMAGGDLKTFHDELDRPAEQRRQHFELFVHRVHPIIQIMRRMPQPIVASVSGAAGGFGMSLILASDLALAADDSTFTMAYCLIGTSPDGSSTWFLPRTVGLKKAMELALLGDRFDAPTAERLGIVNRIVTPDHLAGETEALARRLANGPARAYANTKKLLGGSGHASLDQQLQAEAEMFADCASTDDFVEGITAFVEKRKPSFSGR